VFPHFPGYVACVQELKMKKALKNKPSPFPETDSHSTVLVVDDEAVVREVICSVLKEEAYGIIEAANGDDALKLLARSKPDLIISDVKMPGMDGNKLLEIVKADESYKHIPFILITGQDSESLKLEGLSAGADDYLSKPFNSKELVFRVKNLVKLYKQEKELIRLNRELEKKVSEQLKDIMQKERLALYFPQKLVRWIISSEKGDEITSEKRTLTVFFSDLTGFTELAEKTDPERMQTVLNEYFTAMVDIIERFDGTLDKFIGDGIMVFFGAPEPLSEQEQAVRAVAMAVEMHRTLKGLAARWRQNGIPHNINVRMGVHQDQVLVGNFGSSQLMEYTVIGSGVNLANRLESYCEPQKILVSEKVRKYTEHDYNYGQPFKQQFRGFDRLIEVSELDPFG
jgi:class 3 adenylate cyclase